jgi:hypothetical protein
MNITIKDGLKYRLKHTSDGIAVTVTVTVTVRFTVTGHDILLGRNNYQGCLCLCLCLYYNLGTVSIPLPLPLPLLLPLPAACMREGKEDLNSLTSTMILLCPSPFLSVPFRRRPLRGEGRERHEGTTLRYAVNTQE